MEFVNVETDVSNIIYEDGTDEIEGLAAHVHEVARQVQSWAKAAQDSGVPSMLDRMVWEEKGNPISQMKRARHELNSNDLVGSAAEIVEGLSFQGLKWESGDSAIADCWNQMAAEQNLDDVVRKCSRETFACSQVVVAAWWDWGTFKVRGKTKNGNKRKSEKRIYYPRRIAVLDPSRVVPVGLIAFGQERLAYEAVDEEWEAFKMMEDGDAQDELMKRLFVSRYTPSELEAKRLDSWGINVKRLILLNSDLVRRHTLTKSDFEPFAPVRLRSVFRLIDLRQQLMEADRASLVGQANYILLVKKGDKDRPATQDEVSNLKAGFKTIAKVPVIFSDHRLEIEIVAPRQDFTLVAEKYDLLDRRIVQRLISTFSQEQSTRTSQTSSSVGIGISTKQVLEGRRRMLRRFLEVLLAREVVNHEQNKGLAETPPSMAFSPANISIGDDTALAQQILSLRTQKELSRGTTLEYFGFDQEAEAVRREIEEEIFDDIFQTTVPFSAAGPQGNGQGGDGNGAPPADQGGRGAEGGRPAGGGSPSNNPTKTNVTKTGNTSSKGAK